MRFAAYHQQKSLIVHQMVIMLGLLLATNSVFAKILTPSDLTVGFLTTKGSATDQTIQSLSGIGFKAEIDFHLLPAFNLGIATTQLYYTINQTDAIKNWNWPYWQKIYGSVISSVQNDPYYSVQVIPYQNLKIKTFDLQGQVNRRIWQKLHCQLLVGTGLVWYSRQLYIEEKWQKYYPSLNYYYRYSFRNYADPRSGWLWNWKVGVALAWHFSPKWALGLGIEYLQFEKNRHDSRYCPLQSALTPKIFVRFDY